MLNGEGCQELGRLRDLATSSDASMLRDVPEDVHKLAGRIVQRRWKPRGLWWKPRGMLEALRRLEAVRAATVSYYDN
jgi:hypothetical protein